MKKLFLLPLAVLMLAACGGGTNVDDGGNTGGGGGGGQGGGSTPVEKYAVKYETLEGLEATLTEESSSTYLVNAKDFTIGGVTFSAAGGKVFGRCGNFAGSEGYKALNALQIKKAGGDVLTAGALAGITKIAVTTITTYTDTTADKLPGIKVNGAAVESKDEISPVDAGVENKDSKDATKTYKCYTITLTYDVKDVTSFALTSPTENAAYIKSISFLG